MAPRKETAPAVTAQTTTAMKTVQGYTIQLLAFIPVATNDLRTQAAIPTILMNIEDGTGKIEDLMPYLKQMEFRVQNTRKRVTEDEFAALFSVAEGSQNMDGLSGASSDATATIGGAE